MRTSDSWPCTFEWYHLQSNLIPYPRLSLQLHVEGMFFFLFQDTNCAVSGAHQEVGLIQALLILSCNVWPTWEFSGVDVVLYGLSGSFGRNCPTFTWLFSDRARKKFARDRLYCVTKRNPDFAFGRQKHITIKTLWFISGFKRNKDP